MWISGKVSDNFAARWKSLLGVPLRKGEDGSDICPIWIGEVLINLPDVCLSRIVEDKGMKMMRSTSFRIRMMAGSETMIGLVNDLRNLLPNEAFIALDIRNVFGEILWVELLKVMLEELSELASFLSSLWGSTAPLILLSDEMGRWRELMMQDGLYQGHNLSSISFCISLVTIFGKVPY